MDLEGEQTRALSPPQAEGESSGNAALDARLAQGVVDFDRGIDTAQIWISAFLVVILGAVASLALFQVPYHGLAREMLLETSDFHRVATAANHLDVAPEAPLTLFSYGATWQAVNGTALGFHLVNMTLHLLVAVLVYLVARQLLGRSVSEPVAMTAGMLLAVHPLAAVNLGMIVGRASILAAAFMLLGLWIYLRATTEQRTVGPVALVSVVASFALAFASQSTALAFPILLLAADVAHGGSRRNTFAHGIMFATAALLVAVRLGAGVGADETYPEGFVAVLKAQSEFAGAALGYLFVPVGLAPVAPSSQGAWNVIGAAAIVMSAYAGVVLSLRRSALGLPLIWFSVISLAAPCLLPLEHLLAPQNAYLLLPAPVMLLPWIVARFPQPGPRAAAGLVAAAFILLCAWFNYRDLLRYNAPLDFWRNAATVQSTPETQRFLARELMAAAEAAETPAQAGAILEQAASAWHAVLAQAPEDLTAKVVLGRLFHALGRSEEALPLFEEVLRRRPNDAEVTLLLASHHAQQLTESTDKQVLQGGMDWLRRAESLGDLPPEIVARYGATLVGMGNFSDGYVRLRKAHGEEAPLVKQVEAHVQRLQALEQQSLQLLQDGKLDEGLLRRAEMFALQNRLNPAVYLAGRVLRESPSNTQAWVLLGYLEAALGNADAFVERHAAKAPQEATAWQDLARRAATGGYWEAAEIYMNQWGSGWDEGSSALLELARIALELERPAKAAELVETAAAAQPESYQVELFWAEVELARGDLEAAGQHLDAAAALGALPDAIEPIRALIADKSKAELPVRSRIE
jgi:tetratricopeptide (TPR) repeat protein